MILVNSIVGITATLVGSQKHGLELFDYVSLAFDGFAVLMGFGLLLRLELIRGITNIVCWLGVVSGLKFLAGGIFGTLFSSYGLLIALYGLIKVVVYGMMIYLVGETDKYSYS